jgi:sister-chromatid-cohesion protein PDS5
VDSRCSIRAAIDSVNLEYLLPLPKKDDDESAWVDRLLVVMQHLTDKQTTTFLCLTRLAEK